jgi:hypothetical protein
LSLVEPDAVSTAVKKSRMRGDQLSRGTGRVSFVHPFSGGVGQSVNEGSCTRPATRPMPIINAVISQRHRAERSRPDGATGERIDAAAVSLVVEPTVRHFAAILHA